MSNPPSRSPSGTLIDPAAVPSSGTLTEKPDRPLLYKAHDDMSAMVSHPDENNENEAVRTRCIRAGASLMCGI